MCVPGVTSVAAIPALAALKARSRCLPIFRPWWSVRLLRFAIRTDVYRWTNYVRLRYYTVDGLFISGDEPQRRVNIR